MPLLAWIGEKVSDYMPATWMYGCSTGLSRGGAVDLEFTCQMERSLRKTATCHVSHFERPLWNPLRHGSLL